MRVFVRCDGEGRILSVAKVTAMPEGLAQPFGQVGEDETVVEIEHRADLRKLAALAPAEIASGFRLDPRRKRLTGQRGSGGGSDGG